MKSRYQCYEAVQAEARGEPFSLWIAERWREFCTAYGYPARLTGFDAQETQRWLLTDSVVSTQFDEWVNWFAFRTVFRYPETYQAPPTNHALAAGQTHPLRAQFVEWQSS